VAAIQEEGAGERLSLSFTEEEIAQIKKLTKAPLELDAVRERARKPQTK
jgi:hypothetical protein